MVPGGGIIEDYVAKKYEEASDANITEISSHKRRCDTKTLKIGERRVVID